MHRMMLYLLLTAQIVRCSSERDPQPPSSASCGGLHAQLLFHTKPVAILYPGGLMEEPPHWLGSTHWVLVDLPDCLPALHRDARVLRSPGAESPQG